MIVAQGNVVIGVLCWKDSFTLGFRVVRSGYKYISASGES